MVVMTCFGFFSFVQWWLILVCFGLSGLLRVELSCGGVSEVNFYLVLLFMVFDQ